MNQCPKQKNIKHGREEIWNIDEKQYTSGLIRRAGDKQEDNEIEKHCDKNGRDDAIGMVSDWKNLINHGKSVVFIAFL